MALRSDESNSYYSNFSGDTLIADRQDDAVIVVMGMTGTGKSSFVRLMSGDTSIKISDSLESETAEIQVVRYIDPESGYKIAIVDTPGFDDSREGVSDTDILKQIAEFLLNEYDGKRKLNGLVYLQRISTPRFGGQSARNLRMFKALCGSENFKNVVILTTFWDKVTEEEGSKREEQLKNKYFKELVNDGSQFMRHDHDSTKTARDVLEHIFALLPTNVRIQEEIRKEGKCLEDTTAGSVHSAVIERMIAKHKEEIAAIREEMRVFQAKVKETLDKLLERLARLEAEKSELKNALKNAEDEIERRTLQEKRDQERRARLAKEEEVRQREKEEQERRDQEKQKQMRQLLDEREKEARERKDREATEEWERSFRDREREARKRKEMQGEGEKELQKQERRRDEEEKTKPQDTGQKPADSNFGLPGFIAVAATVVAGLLGTRLW